MDQEKRDKSLQEIQRLEKELANETDPVKKESIQKSIDTLKSVINLVDNLNEKYKG